MLVHQEMHTVARAPQRALSAWWVALCWLACAACSQSAEQPDVILIVVDTLRADHMSLYGYPRATTPRLDALAAKGLVFDNASAGSSWTLPSMAMLMTGAYDGRNGGTLDQPWPTLAESMQAAGYATSAIVANPILGGERDEGEFAAGFERGFDHFDAVSKRYGLKRGEVRQTNGWYGDEVVRRGVQALQDSSAPAFLWLQLYDPHFPRTPRRADMFNSEPAEVRQALNTWRTERVGEALQGAEADYVRAELDAYDTEVWCADAAIGDLIDWLAVEGRLDNTLIVVTSDHGEGLWTRALPVGEEPKVKNEVPRLYMDHGIMLHSEQVRVPLVMVGPGVPVGARPTQAVSLVDVAPTVAALLDLDWQGAAEGLRGQHLWADPAREVFAFCSRSESVTLNSRWRLHWPSASRREQHGDAPQLFDLVADPLERHPLDPAGPLLNPEAPDLESLGLYLQGFRASATQDQALSSEAAALRRDFLDALGYVDQ